ncbi:MAG: nitrogenase [Synechococcales cyanobacterium RU_4_20]|nr:nitrogenase [Synechococcales cyanobacterium RU_4_20]NJR68234.1 nitrogenase [Synechococcales cyanobacterium CRU_2_2]
MTTAVQSPYTAVQMTVWLRGLLSIAWADGKFDRHEQELIGELIQEIAPSLDVDRFEAIAVDELVTGLGDEVKIRENFLRTAVMVALADGVYSSPEDKMLQMFCQGLDLDTAALQALRSTLVDECPEQTGPEFETVEDECLNVENTQPELMTFDALPLGAATSLHPPTSRRHLDVLKPARVLLDGLDVDDPRLAHFLCKMIPSQCPFERDVKLFGHKVVHIPPLCKLNPLYEQLVSLRFRALCYLADDLGEDVSAYC